MVSAASIGLAVATGVGVIIGALAVLLVALFVTLSMRGRQERGGQRRAGTPNDADEAAARAERQRDRDIHDVEEATARAQRQRERDIARDEREDIGRGR
jgi:hypothetical protein